MNICHTCGNSNLFERYTVVKCTPADICHTVWNSDRFKQCATEECAINYICNTIRYRHACQLGAVFECTVADSGNLLAVNFIGNYTCRTVSCVSGYFCRTVIKFINNKTSSIGKSVFNCVPVSPCIIDIVYLKSVCLLCFRAIYIIVISKSFITDNCHTCGNSNLFERCAVIECSGVYMCHTVWYSNRFKRCTIRECTITYNCHTVRYRYTCQLSAAAECVVADLSNLLTVDFRRNYTCRTVSDIFGYFQCTVVKLIGEETSFIGKTVFEGIHMSVCIFDIIYLESIDLLCSKAITIIVISKSIIVNICHTFRNGNRLERYTVVKCTPADICHTIRYSNTCQLSTIDECAVTDPDDLLTVNFTGNFICRTVSDIFAYFQCTIVKLIGEETIFIRKAVFSSIIMSVCILDIIYLESIDLLYFRAIYIIVISKSIIFNICHACRNSNLFERCAVTECTTAYIYHTVWNSDCFKRCATEECAINYICNTIRYRHACQLGAVFECTVADSGNLLAVNFIGNYTCRTVSCVSGYFCRTVIKFINNKTSSIGKSVFNCVPVSPCIIDIVYLKSVCLLCFRAISNIIISKSFITDRCHTCRNSNLFEQCAVIECSGVYLCHTVWYSNRFKRCTIRECTITYTCHTVRYRYTCQLSTIVECVVADLSNPLTVYFRRNYICRTVSDIFGYFQCTVVKLMGEETSFIGKTVFEGIHMSVCIFDIIYLESIDLLCSKAITIIVISKSIIVNICHTFRNGNRLERYTVVKCTPADICHTIRYSNTCQLSTIDECAVTDPDDLLTVNFTGNFICRTVSDIFAYFQCTIVKLIGEETIFIRKAVFSSIIMSVCILDIIYLESIDLLYFRAIYIRIISESFITDISHACGNSNRLERCAVTECLQLDICYTIGYCYTCKTIAVKESSIPDRSYAVWDRNACKFSTT